MIESEGFSITESSGVSPESTSTLLPKPHCSPPSTNALACREIEARVERQLGLPEADREEALEKLFGDLAYR